MSELREEAKRLIEEMPEVELRLLMSTLRKKAKPVDAEEDKRRAMAALDRIVERARKNRDRIPADFDYKKELEEAREERYKKYV